MFRENDVKLQGTDSSTQFREPVCDAGGSGHVLALPLRLTPSAIADKDGERQHQATERVQRGLASPHHSDVSVDQHLHTPVHDDYSCTLSPCCRRFPYHPHAPVPHAARCQAAAPWLGHFPLYRPLPWAAAHRSHPPPRSPSLCPRPCCPACRRPPGPRHPPPAAAQWRLQRTHGTRITHTTRKVGVRHFIIHGNKIHLVEA